MPLHADERRWRRLPAFAGVLSGGVRVRKLVVYELISLDGVAESPEEFLTDWDDVTDGPLADVIAGQDAVLLGRRSYDEWSRFWPDSTIEPVATFINGGAKFVATSPTPHAGRATATAAD